MTLGGPRLVVFEIKEWMELALLRIVGADRRLVAWGRPLVLIEGVADIESVAR